MADLVVEERLTAAEERRQQGKAMMAADL
jgi:nucleoside 2-deoxyribosyltransferase